MALSIVIVEDGNIHRDICATVESFTYIFKSAIYTGTESGILKKRHI
jgi:hypothetical protein